MNDTTRRMMTSFCRQSSVLALRSIPVLGRDTAFAVWMEYIYFWAKLSEESINAVKCRKCGVDH